MSPEEDNEAIVDEDKKAAIESFMTVYISNYRDYLSKKDLDERHLPGVYKGYPFVIEAYILPNNSVAVVLKKSNRSRVLAINGEFDDIRKMISERNFDYMQTFPPYSQWTEDEAERISAIDAERDLSISRRLEILGSIESHMDDIMKESDKMLQLNPWLDEQSKAQLEKIDHAKGLILELYKEIELDDNERFARYEKELMEVQAFEMSKIETIASEMEMEVETAVEEVEEQFGELESQMNELEGGFEELKDELKDALKKMEDKILDLSQKLDSAGTSAETEEFITDIKELREADRKMNTSIRNADKEIKDLKKNINISEEIKDTVFRDSKRIHNLNERITDIEKEVKSLASSKTTKLEDDIKAMVKRLDKLDKDIKEMVKKAVDFEFEARKPIVREEPPPPDTPPKGSTVKKTTKKTTTKKTKKKSS